MAEKIFTRMGDGSGIFLSPEDIRYDLEEGTKMLQTEAKFRSLPRKNWIIFTKLLPCLLRSLG